MASVTFSSSVGGDNSTVTDDASPTTGLANGGHRTRFVAALAQLVAVASNAVASATSALGYRDTALTHANTAQGYRDTALTYSNNANTSFINTDKKYLGAKASAPTLDNQGAALAVGSMYYNSTNTNTYVWSGSVWVLVNFVPTAASGVSFTPANGLTDTTVQTALATLALRTVKVWSIKTANYTLVAGDDIQADTRVAGFTLTLPATPLSTMAPIYLEDYIGTFTLNRITLAGNGSPIMGLLEDMEISSNWASLEISYIDATVGWRVR
jgi:hypothetical protein